MLVIKKIFKSQWNQRKPPQRTILGSTKIADLWFALGIDKLILTIPQWSKFRMIQ